MRRQGWSVLALVVVTLPLCGQDQSKANYSSPKFELFAGYSLRTTRMFKEPAYYPAIYPPYLSPLLLRRENAH